MTQLSGFWTTSGAGAGHQVSGYTQAHWSTAGAIMAACSGFEGVAPGFLNKLAGTVTGANTVAIDTGGAMVDGKWYHNSASVNVNIPSAVGGGNTRIDRIVLRCSWGATFTVVIYRIAGTDAASPTAPAITQTTGTTYDIMLYQALVDTGGTVTITDERVWATRNLVYRRGGSATNWNAAGTTNYVAADPQILSGSVAVSGGSGTAYALFPRAFAYVPIAMAICGSNVGYYAAISSVTATELYVRLKDKDGGDAPDAQVVFWIAIGQKA